MKIASTRLALSALATLAACGGGGDSEAANIEASAENQSDALEMEAANISEQADNASGAQADMLDNQATALENQAENVSEEGEAKAEAVDDAN